MNSVILDDDPLQMNQEQISQYDLKITSDIKFLLEVDFNLTTPKIKQAMINLQFTDNDILQKNYFAFIIPDEDEYLTKQRYYLHLHQIAFKRKQLVRERNRIKKEEIETQKWDSQFSQYSMNEYSLPTQIIDVVSKLDKKIEQVKLKKERAQQMIENKLKEEIENELKLYNVSKEQELEKIKIFRMKRKSLQNISDRAHSFNQRIEQISKEHKIQIKKEQDLAFKKQIERNQSKSQESPRISDQLINQKEKELKEILKQKEARNRIDQIRRQEIEQCNNLYRKIEQKLNKSLINRIEQLELNKTYVPQSYQNNNHSQESNNQQQIAAFIKKQQKVKQYSQNSLKSSSRHKIINDKTYIQEKQQIIKENDKSIDQNNIKKIPKRLSKDIKSRSVINLEKVKYEYQQKINKVIEKQHQADEYSKQIKLKQETLQNINKSIGQQRTQYEDLQTDLQKLKANMSKELVAKQISKWNCPDLIDKYLK